MVLRARRTANLLRQKGGTTRSVRKPCPHLPPPISAFNTLSLYSTIGLTRKQEIPHHSHFCRFVAKSTKLARFFRLSKVFPLLRRRDFVSWECSHGFLGAILCHGSVPIASLARFWVVGAFPLLRLARFCVMGVLPRLSRCDFGSWERSHCFAWRVFGSWECSHCFSSAFSGRGSVSESLLRQFPRVAR